MESDWNKAFQWLTDQLQRDGIKCSRVIIFCQEKSQCQILFEMFSAELGSAAYASVDGPENDTNRLFGMYHRSTREDQKKTAEESFANPHGHMRVLICTSSFGMGMDVQGCHLAIHLGPPKMLDAYLQESGRIGRDGLPSHSLVLMHRRCLSGPGFEKEMKKYVQNNTCCRRNFLLQAIENPQQTSLEIAHTCCDICAVNCRCLCSCLDPSDTCDCSPKCVGPSVYQSDAEQHFLHAAQQEEKSRITSLKMKYSVSDTKRELFKLQLFDLQDRLLSPGEKRQTLAGQDVTTGFSYGLIANLTDHLEYISSHTMLLEYFPFFSQSHASLVYSCVEDVLCSEDELDFHETEASASSESQYSDGYALAAEYNDTESDESSLGEPVLFHPSSESESESQNSETND